MFLNMADHIVRNTDQGQGMLRVGKSGIALRMIIVASKAHCYQVNI